MRAYSPSRLQRPIKVPLLPAKQRPSAKIGAVAGWFATCLLGSIVVAEFLGTSRFAPMVFAQAILPFIVVVGGLLSFGAAFRRRRALAVVCATLVVALTVIALWPLRPYALPVPMPSEPRLSVAFANALDRASNSDKADSLVATGADVLVAVEASESFLKDMDRSNVQAEYPYLARTGQDYQDRVGIWSRYPIANVKPMRFGHAAALISLTVDGHDVRLLAAHLSNGVTGSYDSWKTDLASIASVAATLTGPVLVVGDFNATLAHPALRIMQNFGYREVHSWLGHGLRPSWPMNASPLPPLMRIDHAFVRGGVLPLSVRDFTLTDSDHRGFVADFVLRS